MFKHQGCTKRELFLGIHIADSLPNDFPTTLVQSGDLANIPAIARKDQHIIDNNRGTSIAMYGRVEQVVILPNDLTLGSHAGRALVAKVNEYMLTIKHGSWAGM